MKNFLVSLFLYILTFNSYAENLKVEFILPVKSNATQYILAQEIKPLLEKKGYIIDINVSGNCIKAGKDFKESKTPSAMFIFNAYSALPECKDTIPNNQNWVYNLTKSKLFICGKTEFDHIQIIKNKEIHTIGSVDIYPSSIIKTLNPNFKYVPYNSSGALVRGYLAGDTDFLITNVLRATDLVKNNRAKCSIVTGNQDLLGATAASKIFPNWAYANTFQLFSLVHTNFNKEQSEKFKKDIKDILNSNEFTSFAEKNGYEIDLSINADNYIKSSNLWRK